MANKFQQSVMQRLEQEQKVQQKSKPATKTVTKNNKPQPKIEPEIKVAQDLIIDAATTPEIEVETVGLPDMSDYLRHEPSRTAKNKTFYLDVEVIDALCAAARRQHVTDSKLVNDILLRVLGIGGK